MKTHEPLNSHFSSHWLPWLALHHFLPVADLREVASGMTVFMSSGQLALNDLFDERLIDADFVSESWIITPKQASTPLAKYLQGRIRSLVWKDDARVFFDPSAEWNSVPVHPSLLEAVVSLGSRPSSHQIARARAGSESENHPALKSLLDCIEASWLPADRDKLAAYVDAIEAAVHQVEMPLRAAMLKFAGDGKAMNDAWQEAESIYERVLTLLSREHEYSGGRISSALATVTVQSLATASRVLGGKDAARQVFDTVMDRWPNIDSTLFSVNASNDSQIAHTTENHWPDDTRTSALRAPLVISSHSLANPILEFLESAYQQANDGFYARLRRQIALGATAEARIAKAVYARSIVASLTEDLQKRRDPDAFAIAAKLFIESGAPKLLSTIEWNTGLVDTYVSTDIIQRVHSHSAAFEGTRVERQIVAIELLTAWATRLPSVQQQVGTTILRILASFAKENSATFDSSTDIGSRSLKSLKEIAACQPEWQQSVSKPVADAIVERFSNPGWWTGVQHAAETASAYAAAFARDDLASVVEAAVGALDAARPGVWPIIRPIEDFIISAPASAFIREDKNLEKKVVGLLLRHGTAEQGTEHANLVRCLRAFDARLLDDPDLQVRLRGVVQDIVQKAQKLNSSASQTNIQALLGAPTLSGPEGINVAIASLKAILESIDSPQHSISFQFAYYPLLQIAVEHSRIEQAIGATEEEFINNLLSFSNLLERIWNHAARDPSIFVPFSIPPNHIPDSITVHNWTFVSLQFARLIGKEEIVEKAIDSAARAQPILAKAIDRAKAIQSLSVDADNFDESQVEREKAEVFYLNLGSRLSQLSNSTDKGRTRCLLLLQMCLHHGPNDLDMAVFVAAAQYGLMLAEAQQAAIPAYVARLNASPDRRLNFMPLLKQLGYEQSSDRDS